MGKIENGVYYDSTGLPVHKGIVECEGKIYYAGARGKIVKNKYKMVYPEMTNGLVRYGIYRFDKNGVIDLNSLKSDRETKGKKRTVSPKLVMFEKILFAVLVGFCVLAVILVGPKYFESSNSGNGTDTKQSETQTKQLEIELPEYDGNVYLCSDTMKKYYEGDITLKDVIERGATAYSPFVFEYSIKNAQSSSFELINESDNSTVIRTDLDLDKKSLSIDNLYTNTVYKYIVTSVDEDGQEHIKEGRFKTADTNRFISLPGVYNTRDIGGYDTSYGKTVKQGLLIRGTELDGLVEPSYFLTDAEATQQFAFKYDFDLRSSTIFNTKYISRLGSIVKHKFYDSPMYGGIFTVGNESTLKEIFTDLSNANNYPMYLHCTYGADRTGTIILLLQGLLGVSEEDMRTEYALTGFFISNYVNGSNINPIFAGVEGCKGNTINEKIESYMIDTVGITKAQIQSIRDIFLK